MFFVLCLSLALLAAGWYFGFVLSGFGFFVIHVGSGVLGSLGGS